MDAGEGSIGAGGSNDEGGGTGGRGDGAGGIMGTTGRSIGGGGGVRGRLAGPDLVAGVLGVGVLVSEFGTTLLITLVPDRGKNVVRRLRVQRI